jgi:hypothetical protein
MLALRLALRAVRRAAASLEPVGRVPWPRGVATGSTGPSIEEVYQRKTPVEHVLLRPGACASRRADIAPSDALVGPARGRA